VVRGGVQEPRGAHRDPSAQNEERRNPNELTIENSNQRFYAYNHFGQHPERLIGWFDRHMGGRAMDQAGRPSAMAAR
jgi:hypothetical protein